MQAHISGEPFAIGGLLRQCANCLNNLSHIETSRRFEIRKVCIRKVPFEK